MTDVVELRRLLHSRAETAFCEVATTATLLEALAPVLVATGVWVRRGSQALDPSAVVGYPQLDDVGHDPADPSDATSSGK